MTNEALNRARTLHRAIQKALLTEWDPIGVRGIPGADDEYDGYIPTVYKMLISQKPVHELFDYLWWLETVHMGLKGDRQATERFAQHLVQLAAET